MKISKSRIQQIIKEELEKVEKEQGEAEQEANPENKQAMAKKFKDLYTLFPKIQGIDRSEIELLNALIMAAIKAAKEGSAKAPLAMALKKLGVK
tara:strand:- start:10168 stop:10449 length:282 start_codon:yes stop_codon:yes gene_type:complete